MKFYIDTTLGGGNPAQSPQKGVFMSQNSDDFVPEYDGEVPDFLNEPAPAQGQGQAVEAVQGVQTAPAAQAGQAEGQPASVSSQRTLGGGAKRTLPAGDEHPEASINRLEEAYMSVTGESMSAETRANMYSFMSHFGIRSNDAIMCLLIANGHIDNRMQKLPHQLQTVIEKAARDVLDNCEKASEDVAKKSSLKLLQQVSDKIDEGRTGGKWQHIAWASPIFIIGLLLGNMMGKMRISEWLVGILF